MACMYGLEMLRHPNGCLASSNVQQGEIERDYTQNAHIEDLIGVGRTFHQPVSYDIPTDEDRLHTSSDVESNSNEEVDPVQACDESERVDAIYDYQGVFSPYLLYCSNFYEALGQC